MSATWSPVLRRPFSMRRQAMRSAFLCSWLHVSVCETAPLLFSRVKRTWSAVDCDRHRRISDMN